jgi:hypothetical protein
VAVVGWADTDEVAEDWTDSPPAAQLTRLLAVAHELLVEYVGPANVLDPPPERYGLAQVMLTQHLWARKRGGDGDTFGPDGFQFSTYPLVMEARGLMKPKTSPLAGLL